MSNKPCRRVFRVVAISEEGMAEVPPITIRVEGVAPKSHGFIMIATTIVKIEVPKDWFT